MYGSHFAGFMDPTHGCKHFLLKQILAVEGNVKEEPGGRGAHEVLTVAPQELNRKQSEFRLVRLLIRIKLKKLSHQVL
ncbi:hypothetical protein SUGI_0884820 [Cryptomeria japonica]|nr:hypothetical protein SUGI_0884820 [Cryptomeria japonica]